MIIGHRFIFVHIPKTGGSAIERALGIYPENKQVAIGDHVVPTVEQAGVKLVYGVVRHPYELYQSWWKYTKQVPVDGWKIASHAKSTRSFEEYVVTGAKERMIGEVYSRYIPLVNVWGHYGRLEEDLNKMLRMIGHPRVKLELVNVSKGEAVDDPGLRELVEKSEPWLMDMLDKLQDELLVL